MVDKYTGKPLFSPDKKYSGIKLGFIPIFEGTLNRLFKEVIDENDLDNFFSAEDCYNTGEQIFKLEAYELEIINSEDNPFLCFNAFKICNDDFYKSNKKSLATTYYVNPVEFKKHVKEDLFKFMLEGNSIYET